jgi:hypothetical protein
VVDKEKDRAAQTIGSRASAKRSRGQDMSDHLDWDKSIGGNTSEGSV